MIFRIFDLIIFKNDKFECSWDTFKSTQCYFSSKMEIIDYDVKYREQCNNCLLTAWKLINNQPQYVIDYIQKHTQGDPLKTQLNRLVILHNQKTEERIIIGIIYCKVINKEIYIKHLAVLPDYQGQGIATALLNDVKNYAYQHQMSKMWLYVEQFNIKAIKFYEKYGFINKGLQEIVPNREYSNLYEYSFH